MRLGRRPFRLVLLLAAATAVVSGSLPALLWGAPPAAAQEAPAAPSTGQPATTTYDSFRPGQPWLDTGGKPIQAHGGQVVVTEDTDGSWCRSSRGTS
ncbi:hypothetical protein SAMN05421678_104122 [Actinopolymorpha cephalotaxi]|uniref:Uncharacterized protein n=1 Tax=Actinopolymorpha cephalotaxi TaxID=504797 RepID=A0A1I2PFE0_9ACTN|nr:hypothetical protein [Actinopolymorpha cephalotaxi]NYH83626.1 hypothetical protein [Actinopolymorpha cephalotaxi]SFG14872.1 hypothetical protein SAMN05421678_104122 [Actinopolymorpha cephalotaxi]